MKNKKILVCENLEDMSKKAEEKFYFIYKEKKGNMNIALSGGNTPKLFFQNLALNKDIFWKNINIFLVDERYVITDSKDSNSNLLHNFLIDKIEIPQENIHTIPYLETLEKSFNYYEKDLINSFNLKEGEYPKFDFLLLGMGDDGHTASLFPEIFNKKSKEIARSVGGIERLNYDRISLGMESINNSETIIFLISGSSKSEIIKKILIEEDDTYPAFHVSAKKELIYYLDKKSAKYIG